MAERGATKTHLLVRHTSRCRSALFLFFGGAWAHRRGRRRWPTCRAVCRDPRAEGVGRRVRAAGYDRQQGHGQKRMGRRVRAEGYGQKGTGRAVPLPGEQWAGMRCHTRSEGCPYTCGYRAHSPSACRKLPYRSFRPHAAPTHPQPILTIHHPSRAASSHTDFPLPHDSHPAGSTTIAALNSLTPDPDTNPPPLPPWRIDCDCGTELTNTRS